MNLQGFKSGLREWYIPLVFTVLYIAVVFVYRYSPENLWENHILAFLTSPFNFKENLSDVYSSPQQGLVANLMIPVIIMFGSLVYYHFLANSKRIRPELIFWNSVFASYLVSILNWLFAGAPTIGTSIIGFSMIAFLCGSTLRDLRDHFWILWHKPDLRGFARVLTFWVFLIPSWSGVILVYLLGNNAIWYHLLGGLFCGTLSLVLSYYKKPTISK